MAAAAAAAALGAAGFQTLVPKGAYELTVGAKGDFATLDAALAEVAKLRKADTNTPMAIKVAPGRYTQTKAVHIGREHARIGWGELTIVKAGEEKPLLFGGAAVTGWKKSGDFARGDVWEADISGLGLKHAPKLFHAGGKRMEMARYPNADPAKPYTRGFALADGKTKAGSNQYNPEPDGMWNDEVMRFAKDVRGWSKPEEGLLMVWPRHNWWNRVYRIKGADGTKITLEEKHVPAKDGLHIWDRYIAMGLREELDAPGEWYCDREKGKMYFIPPKGFRLNEDATTMPVDANSYIINVHGAGNLTIAGLEIAGGNGGIRIMASDRVKVIACDIHDCGFHDGRGVDMQGHWVEVRDCNIWNIGSHGVFAHGIWAERKVGDRLNNTVENNYIHHCGLLDSHGIGIWIAGQGIYVRHNLLHDMPRCGTFGYGKFCDIAYNRIRHVNTCNDDTGAMYGGGWTGCVGTTVRYNWISDSIGFQRQRDGKYRLYKGACGIYPDEGAGGMTVYGNLVENCHNAAMHLHNGRWITISNNVFVSNAALPVTKGCKQLSLQTWDNDPKRYFVKARREAITKEWERLVKADPGWTNFPSIAQSPHQDEKTFLEDGTTMMGVHVKNNIFYYPDQKESWLLSGWRVNPQANPFDRNVYWNGTTNVVMATAVKGGWKGWLEAGQDRNSAIADPMFRDAARGDYRLKKGSPALRLGFEELPYGKMGLQRTRFRPVLPREAEGVREHPEWLEE